MLLDVKILLKCLEGLRIGLFKFFCLADVPLPYISKHLRPEDLVFPVQLNGRFTGIHGI